jgi:hypothetical protein
MAGYVALLPKTPRPILVSLLLAACSESAPVSLTTTRLGHTTAAVGDHLYVFGGGNRNTIERATVNGDGTLGPFATLNAITLASERTAHTSAVIGDFVYVFGGATAGAPSSVSIERAPINHDGAITAFQMVSGVVMTAPRAAHATAVSGGHIYVLGGTTNGTSLLDSVERAAINLDGSLDPFRILSGVNLLTARRNFTSIVLGGYLYALGGSGTSGDLDTIERAAIGADGSLAPFEVMTGFKLGSAGFDQAFVVIGEQLYVSGGLSGAAVPSRTVAAAPVATDGALGTFANASTSLVVARGTHTATVVNGHVFVLGGMGTNGILTSVERAAIGANGTIDDFENLSD